MRRSVSAVLFSLLWLPAGAWAQTAPPPHVATRAAIDQLLASQASQERADRDAIRTLLQRPEVREAAGRYGLSIERAAAAVNTLDGDQLRQIAAQARQAEALSGGASTVTFSTTTIIIALLVIILLIVALK